MIRIALLLLGCVMLAGCATSKYLQTYVPDGDAAQAGAAAQTAADYKPKVRRSKELDADIAELREEGYIVLGSSDFTDALESDDGIYQQAQANGATLVLKKITFIKTETVDKSVYVPNSTTDNTTPAGRGPSRGGSYGGTSPTAGASWSQSDTKQVDLYRQQAVFLKREE